MSRFMKMLVLGGTTMALLAAAVCGWQFRDRLGLGGAPPAAEADGHPAHSERECVQLSPQARANLRLAVQPIRLGSYARTIPLPGTIIEHPGKSEHGAIAPLAGVVQRVAAFQGMTVRPGDELFTLRIVSELVYRNQAELYRTSRELQIIQEQRARLEKAGSALPESRLLELDYQQRRQAATLESLRFELAARGLTPPQIAAVAEGKFVTEVVVRVPDHPEHGPLVSKEKTADLEHGVFEVEELKVHLGEHVAAGQILCALGNHQSLCIEGRAFKQELELVERAVGASWPVEVDFVEAEASRWPAFNEKMTIRFLGNRIDPASQTVPFYLVLPNSYREHQQAGRTYRTWRFYPGQRVRLRVPVEEFRGVFVLPSAAVVREGGEAYVFRANGDVFDRIAVHVRYEERHSAVIANDGSINEGNHVAQNSAAALNRILKAQAEGAGHGGHAHPHDH